MIIPSTKRYKKQSFITYQLKLKALQQTIMAINLADTVFCILLNLEYSQSVDIKIGMLSPFRHPRLGFENNAAAATIAIDKAAAEGLICGVNVT